MTITATTVNDYMESAIDAIGDADWPSALTYLRKAWAGLIALPDSGNPNSYSMTWNRESIKDLIAECEAKYRESNAPNGGLRFVKLNPTRVSAPDSTSGASY